MAFSENSNYKRESLLEVITQNIAGWCQQTFCFQKFVHNTQQCFAFTPQANFPTHDLNLIESRLPFKIFSSLFELKKQEFPYLSFVFNLRDGASHQTCKYCLQSGFKTPAMEQKEKKINYLRVNGLHIHYLQCVQRIK